MYRKFLVKNPSNPQHNPERPTRPKEPDPPLPTDRERFKGGRGCDFGEVRTREDPTRPKEPDPHHQRTGRGSERGTGVIWMDWRGELVVRVGWRLTEKGFVGREEENGGRGIIGSS